jgi:predicted O-methyltransferase YrrM
MIGRLARALSGRTSHGIAPEHTQPSPPGADASGTAVAQYPIPAPSDFFSGPPNVNAYRNLPNRIGEVSIQRPSGTISGTLDYAREPGPRPNVPRSKTSAPYNTWQFFRSEQLDPTPKPWPFPAELDNPKCAWLQTLKRLYAMPITFPASISPEGGMLLHSLVRNARPRIVVETGTFLGLSALWIASALLENGDGGVLHCFDDFIPVRPGPWRVHEMKEGVLEFVAAHLNEAGVGRHVVLHPGNTAYEIRAAGDALRASGGVQLAYLDADHRPKGVCQDFWAVEPLLPTGGIVVLHDTFPTVCGDDGPRFLLDHVNEIAAGQYQCLDLFLGPINYGLGLMRRTG